MKRFHVHVSVTDLEKSIQFYSVFFNTDPCVRKDDYAKWMLTDPYINFAISTRSKNAGLDHLGIQVDNSNDLQNISFRLKNANEQILVQDNATCCYAKSDKTWVYDPQGIAWESFYTTGHATTYGEDAIPRKSLKVCCAPQNEEVIVKITEGNQS